ncbi:DUF4968 domain-containing protein [candidate division KSB1 bacterium]|nr:DUF4968 domain-containing protein [candidate division KSB1 bacterium]
MRRLNFLFLSLLFSTMPLTANYQFIGDVQQYRQILQGLHITCQDGHGIEIEFLQADMFRVTLKHANGEEAPLHYAVIDRKWPPVSLTIKEERTCIRAITDRIELRIQKNPCRLSVLDKSRRLINQDDPGMGMGWDGNEVRCWKAITADEKFFGLGEKTGDVNKRGRQYTMWNSDVPGYGNESDPIYQSIPFFIGLRDGQAYGIYFNNSYRSVFNMGAGNLRYYSFAADGGVLDYYFIYGPQISRVVETYSDLTGHMPMPPEWALGYQQCRWSYYPDSEVLTLAQTFRNKKIPADVIHLDIHYMDSYRVFTWDKDRFPDPKGMLQTLQDMGFKVVVIIDPGVKKDDAYWVAQQGLAGGHFVKYPDGEVYIGQVWPGDSYFPDFSRSQTRGWWGSLFNGLLDDGIDGFWCDMNEPACWGQAFPLETIWDDDGLNSSHKKMHNLYGLLMSRSTREGVQQLRHDERPFIITRAGSAGIQRYSAVWTGDNVASEDHLELGIRLLQGLGLSGVSFTGTDVGGFIGTPTPELFARWMQVGALSPFFRTHSQHGTSDQEPWSFGEYIEELNRRTIEWRYRLLPYLYSLVWQSHQTGAPVIRPLFYHDQEDEATFYHEFQHQFFVGEKVLAAPVTRIGQYLKKVYLPAGKWLDLNDDKIYQGAQTVLVEAPLNRLPLFLRQGGILVGREAMQYVGEKPGADLTVDVFPGQGTFMLYEDDGASMAYLQGNYRTTLFELSGDTGRWVLSKSHTHDGYEIEDRTLTVHWHGIETEPSGVTLDGTKLIPGNDTYRYDEGKNLVVIKYTDRGRRQEIVMQ